MPRHPDTLWLPENRSITEIASGQQVAWPGTDENGDFRGRPDDGNTPPSYLDSGWLSRVSRYFGRVFNARSVGQLSNNTGVADLASSVSPYWMEGGVYTAGRSILHQNTQYICTQEHTASSANAPGQANAPWKLAATRNDAENDTLLQQAEQSAKSDASSKDRSLESSLKTLINQAKREAKIEAKNELYPIGSIYINYNNSRNPSSLLGFGTWTALPANYFLAQAGNRYAAGSTYSEALPNIVGVIGTSTRDYRGDYGAFSRGEARDWMFDGGGSMMKDRSHNFNASRSSAIYGRHGDRVQPFTLGAYMWRRIA